MKKAAVIMKAALAKSAADNHAIAHLRIYRDTLAINGPIHRREGKHAQADLDFRALRDTEEALTRLGARL